MPGIDAVLSAGAALAAAGALALIVGHLINAYTFEFMVLNANAEGTVWTWMSVVATGGVALGAALRALVVPAERLVYGALALGAAFLSMDDLTMIHEGIAGRVQARLGLSDAWDSVLWPLVYLPVLGACVLLLLLVARDSVPRIRRHIYAGIGVLGVAVVLEILSAPWSGAQGNAVHTIEGGFEEAAELAGWTLLGAAMLARALHDAVRRAAR